MQVQSRAEVGRAVWDAAADESGEGWLWHRFDFQDALATWPGRHDLSFAIQEDAGSLPLAIVPLHLVEFCGRRPLVSRMLYSCGGAAYRPGLQEPLQREVTEQIRMHLLSQARHFQALEIKLSLSPLAGAYSPALACVKNVFMLSGFEEKATSTWVIDLEGSEEDIRKGYHTLTRRQLRKMQRCEYSIREANDSGDLDRYYALHRETYQRSKIAPHPRAYFESIFRHFIPHGFSRVVFLMQGDTVVAAQNTALYKQAAVYWTGASVSDKAGGENRVLFDDQIMHARKAGCRWYELGEAFPEAKSGKRRGLNAFKRSFGGRLHPCLHSVYDLRGPLRRMLYRVRALTGAGVR